MSIFEFNENVKNKTLSVNFVTNCSKEVENEMIEYLKYIHKESEKGKIPLIIVGSGISNSGVIIEHKRKVNEKSYERIMAKNGLPTLIEMIKKIHELTYEGDDNDRKNLHDLRKIFKSENFDMLIEHIDKEWLSKVFSTLANSESKDVKEIWDKFCNWFLFKCIIEKEGNGSVYGALTTVTTEAAVEVHRLSKNCGALCFSANFDNYLSYNKRQPIENSDSSLFGMSIFSRNTAEKYFIRSRRKSYPKNEILKRYDEEIDNDCVLHANGDVFWLSCSGDKVKGYCPKTGKYLPAYSWFKKNGNEKISEKDMVCDICNSSLHATMTMPGTYKKDRDTREMISAIWKYISSKISTVITVGISCNWDDVLLKFIIGLLFENDIPHLDINSQSDAKIKDIELHKKVVFDVNFSSISLKTDALSAVKYMNEKYESIKKNEDKKSKYFEKTEKEEILKLLERLTFIKRLEKVSQIGLKGYWKHAGKDNNRWKHSKKVAELAFQSYKKMHEINKKTENVSEKVLVYVSGLLHDCGHLPFSHLLEDVFSELSWKLENNEEPFKHGHYTSYLIKKLFKEDITFFPEEERGVVKSIRDFLAHYNVDYEDIIKVIEGNYGIGYIDALINSEIDCDKIAYIFADSDQTNTNLMLNEKEFLDKLLKNAFITQEKLVALDSESAWIAFRLLNERKRLYNELYFARDLRCLELAVKFILTTFFVQRYNELDNNKYKKYGKEEYSDLSHCRIMMVIDDLFNIVMSKGLPEQIQMETSLSKQTRETLKQCMNICLNQIREPDGNHSPDDNPKELDVLKVIYKSLTGNNIDDTKGAAEDNISGINLLPYTDNDINELAAQLSYIQLLEVRKRIHLNFPGVLLIDVYEPVKYLSTAKSRKKHLRIDGTDENQVVYLVPHGDRNTWHSGDAHASLDISDYVKNNKLDDSKPYMNVYKFSVDNTKIEHAINMLKKEMKMRKDSRSEGEDD